jgi:hypothetical protein
MITHLDTEEKFQEVRRLLDLYDMGIAMSKETLDILLRRGMPARRLCYINPAQDGVIKPRPLVVGMACKIYKDGRKDENAITEALLRLPAGAFVFKIMGKGWQEQVNQLRRAGHKVLYHSRFDYDYYVSSFMPSLDYFVYHAYDEGTMAFPDAIAADVKTIVTPQGYHLDIPGAIDYPITGPADVVPILAAAHQERLNRSARVAGWNWRQYTLCHLLVWDYLLTGHSADGQEAWKEFLHRLNRENHGALAAALDEASLPGSDTYQEAIALAHGYGSALAALQLERALKIYYPAVSAGLA